MKAENNAYPYFPLSVSQKNFYLCEKWNKYAVADKWYVVGTCYYDTTGTFDADAMEKAYYEQLRRNDAYRMKLVRENRKVMQYFRNAEDYPKPERRHMKGSISALVEYCKTPDIPVISMWDDFLTQAIIYTCDDGCGGLLLWQHHICTDGYSMEYIGYHQICEYYESYKAGNEPVQPPKLASFGDYVNSERNLLKKNRVRNFIWCWKEYNRHLFQYRVPVRAMADGSFYENLCLDIQGNRMEKLHTFCQESGCTEMAALMTAIALMVYGLTDAQRFAFTNETHGRATFLQKKTAGPLLFESTVFMDFVKPCSVQTYVKNIDAKLIQANVHMRYYTVLQNLYFFMPLLNLFGHSKPGDFGFMFFNNLMTYTSDANLPLQMQTIEQLSTGSAFMIELLDGVDGGIRLVFYYLEKWTCTERAKQLVDIFYRTLDDMLQYPKKSTADFVKMVAAIR